MSTAVASAIIAAAALAFSIASFQFQQCRAARLAKGSVKPKLWIISQTYENLKSIRLWNHGVGPAIIKSAQFEKEAHQPTNGIVDLFQAVNSNVGTPTGPVKWVTFVRLEPGRAIPAQDHITLVEQSEENLLAQHIDKDTARQLLNRWQAEKTRIKVTIEYEDIFGNKMETYTETLNGRNEQG
jgi:hypothetical protein